MRSQNEFCERIGAIYLVNVPAIFRATWLIIEPLIHERVAPRVSLLGDDWRQTVSKLIDDDNLPAALGGKRAEMPLVAGSGNPPSPSRPSPRCPAM